MKKLISLLLAIAIVMTFAVHVVAAELQTSTPAGNALIEGDEIEFDDLLGGTEGEEEPDVTITSAPTGVECEVEGQTVTVKHDQLCKVGYLDDGKYVSVEGTDNGDGTYSFATPEGVTEVAVVVKGDMNLDGVVDMKDAADLQRLVLKIASNTDACALFAAEVTDSASLDMEDAAKLTRYSIKVLDSLK